MSEMVNVEYEKTICIGIPHTGTFPWQTTMSLLGLMVPKGWEAKFHLISSCLIYDARESIVRFARENKCKYILMLDSDMVPPNDFLLKTVALLEAKEKDNVDIVTGMIFKRTPPFQPCFYSKLEYDLETKKPKLESPVEWPKTGIMPLQGVGLASCLIRTKLFDKIDTKKADKRYFFPLPNLGEDLSFCMIARNFGHIVCDLTIDVGHVSAMPITSDHFRACYEEHKRRQDGKPLFQEGENK